MTSKAAAKAPPKQILPAPRRPAAAKAAPPEKPSAPPPRPSVLLYPFRFAIEVSGALLATIEGYAVLAAADAEGARWRMANLIAYAVAPPAIEGDDPVVAEVPIPADHHMHDRIMLWLLSGYAADMDRAWAERAAEVPSP